VERHRIVPGAVVGWRLRSVLLATLTLLFGLHILRVFLPTVLWYLGQFLPAEGLALFALAAFSLTLLAPLVRRWLGELRALALSIGGLALVRLAIQLVRAPAADLALATIGLVFWGWFIALWCQSRRNCRGRSEIPVLAIAFPMAFLIDTGSRSLLLSYDLAWRYGLEATLVVVGLVGGVLVTLGRELREWPGGAVGEAAEEPALRYLLPLLGLGPWLYLALTITHNPAALSAATGWHYSLAHVAVNVFTALGAVAAVWLAGHSTLQRSRWVILGSGLLVGSLASLIAGVGPGWVWVGLASITAWAALGEVFTGTTRIEPLQPGLWRSGVVTFLALATLLAMVIAVIGYDVLWMTPVAGGILGLAALAATRAETGRDGAALGARSNLVGAAALCVLLAVGLWAVVNRPPQPGEVAAEGEPLRVMTYNIHQGINADLVVDLERIAAVITAESPDVVVLNEVNRARATNGFVDTLLLISRRLGMRYVFGANYQDGLYGNALLSRYPILGWDNLHYAHNTTETRGLLRALVQVPGAPVAFFVTHLDHIERPDDARAEQVAEALATWSGAPRTILLGDLNAEPDAPEMQGIYQAGFLDVLWATGQEGVFTFWDAVPSRRIDYIFLTPDLTPIRAWVVPSRASDHLPVLAEVVP
jgi:endonuclease/exonuclease/phosphatase family metal-dependent hydrolase